MYIIKYRKIIGNDFFFVVYFETDNHVPLKEEELC
jgi:hypothetical protein